MYIALRNHCWWVTSLEELDFSLILIEILVDVVDVVLHGSGIDEKFLGLTLFALVPNTTEFMNAVSFAMNGNIALRSAARNTFQHTLLTRIVWRSVQPMHFKSACCKSLQW